MNSPHAHIRGIPGSRKQGGLLDGLFRALVLRRLRGLRIGALTIIDGDKRYRFGDSTPPQGTGATVVINDARAYRDLVFRGSIGAGESYVLGRWSCKDLTGLVRTVIRNPSALAGVERGLARLGEVLDRIWHRLRRNTRNGSRHNIARHYDLGNALFTLFLDETMMYSCAIFEHPGASLKEASIAKLSRICAKLQLGPEDHVLEIGTGWGGFAVHAARVHGCRVTTTTISREQYEFTRQRVDQAGLADRIEVLLCDYRDLTGRYDKLVSIEMIEAIGAAYFDVYFATCSALLKPHGMMLIQAITISDQLYPAAKRSVDFIQRYIFPGGCLPSIAALTDSIARHSDMRLFHLEDMGTHYATTLSRWRERFMTNLGQVRSLGYNEQFIRLWEYYLCYCEGGFLERHISTVQMLLNKPQCRRQPLLPTLST